MGDEIIASGQARLMQQTNPNKVFIYAQPGGAIREHEMWRNNPRIGTRAERPYQPQILVNGPGFRPYIAAKSDRQWSWKEFECTPGEIYFSEDETRAAHGHRPVLVIEPNNKAKASPNKDWGRARWQRLVELLRGAGVKPVQLGGAGTQLLQGVEHIDTPTFRHACAVLAKAKAAVLPEGGLHHAAAALGVPAVVLFGGFISPKQTGYATQTNLFTGGKPCGMRIPCKHCADAMAAITPEMVFAEVAKLLQPRTSTADLQQGAAA